MVRRGSGIRPTAPPVDDYYAPGFYTEPIYSQIDGGDRSAPPPPYPSAPVYPCSPPPSFRECSRRPSEQPLSPLPVVQPYARASSAPIGRRAARFDLKFPKKLRDPERFSRKSFNPIVLTRRGCTDVCCCLLFLVFIAVLTLINLGFMWGKPERLIHPTDSLGRVCGYNRPGAYDLSSRPYVLFFDLTKCISYVTVLTGCPTSQICVSQCPTEYFSYLQLQTVSPNDFKLSVREKIICEESVKKDTIESFTTLKDYVDNGWCAAYTVKSAAVLGRCMPEIFVDAGKALEDAQKANGSLDRLISVLGDGGGVIPSDQKINDTRSVVPGIGHQAVIQKIAADISVSWWQILAMLGVAAVTSFIWTIVMRILGGFMIWLSILILLAILAGGSGYCWYRFKMLTDAGAVNDYSFQPVVSVYFEMPTTWMVFGIITGVLLVITFFIVLYIRSRIRLAVALIQETSRALGHMLSTLFFPIFPFVLHILVFALWASICIWLASSGEENCRRPRPQNPTDIQNGDPCDCSSLGTPQGVDCRYVNITRDNDRVLWLQAYNLFGCFWLTCFVSALSDMTIAGAFASHYFAFRKPKDVPSFPVLRSLGRAVVFHLGTLAFGSLVLAIVKFLQVILDFAYSKLKGATNPVTKGIYMALSCLFWCLETFLKFLSRNAYIITAIYGKGFFGASKDSFGLLARNIVRVVVLNRTTALLLFTGKAVITCGMGAVAFYYFSGRWVIDGLPQITLYYYFVPIIVVIIGSYLICDLFFQVYDMGVDTTFLCFRMFHSLVPLRLR
ncbi:Protein CHTL-1 b [Aphelenchoides avenae]|nr:Protein CHTL-1 b [Aphelenchus avenae]